MSENDTERRKPGRPSNAEVAARREPERKWSTAQDGFTPANVTPPPSPRAAEVSERRRRREGSGAERNMKLHIPESKKDPNFVYRWINARDGRVKHMTENDDYDVVHANEIGGEDPTKSVAVGTVMNRVGDQKTGEGMVLVKKPREYFEADKKEKLAHLAALDEAMKIGPAPNAQGLGPQDNAYVPGGRNRIGQ
jgi:hypothetical protein